MSNNPSPQRVRREDLNSDIMILISKPQGVSKVDPLRLQKSLASSSESNHTSEFESAIRDRKNFNYPPDLKTARQMVK